ncbi:MAG: MBL fold metallo-hydrolase [Treponema sp.]|jgi:glyoxylase-like metal-dependent hydrolase (beta-lactamase superfamily II)|nr:MBL fold metallo-hydrolase [Treponema sp.]
MKLFYQYCSYGFSNCYIIGTDKLKPGQPNAAVIVDPGSIENIILDTIENNNMDLKAVLITHDHLGHVRGLRTLMRIYNVEVFAVNQSIMDNKTTMVKDGDKLFIGGFAVEVISIPGHSSDSVVYRVGDMLFTGDVLTAGLVGSTASAYGAATQMNSLRSRLLSLPGDYIVLPGHGPPSTLEAERRFNTDIFNYDQNRSKRPVFRVDV